MKGGRRSLSRVRLGDSHPPLTRWNLDAVTTGPTACRDTGEDRSNSEDPGRTGRPESNHNRIVPADVGGGERLGNREYVVVVCRPAWFVMDQVLDVEECPRSSHGDSPSTPVNVLAIEEFVACSVALRMSIGAAATR